MSEQTTRLDESNLAEQSSNVEHWVFACGTEFHLFVAYLLCSMAPSGCHRTLLVQVNPRLAAFVDGAEQAGVWDRVVIAQNEHEELDLAMFAIAAGEKARFFYFSWGYPALTKYFAAAAKQNWTICLADEGALTYQPKLSLSRWISLGSTQAEMVIGYDYNSVSEIWLLSPGMFMEQTHAKIIPIDVKSFIRKLRSDSKLASDFSQFFQTDGAGYCLDSSETIYLRQYFSMMGALAKPLDAYLDRKVLDYISPINVCVKDHPAHKNSSFQEPSEILDYKGPLEALMVARLISGKQVPKWFVSPISSAMANCAAIGVGNNFIFLYKIFEHYCNWIGFDRKIHLEKFAYSFPGLNVHVPETWDELRFLMKNSAADVEVNFSSQPIIQDKENLNSMLLDYKQAISFLNQTLAERDDQVAGLYQTMAERDDQVAGLNRAVAELEEQIAGLNNSLNQLTSSRSWRITKPLRHAGKLARQLRIAYRMALSHCKDRSLLDVVSKTVSIWQYEGLSGLLSRLHLTPGSKSKSIPNLERYKVAEHKYTPRLPTNTKPVEKAVRVIAYYLPQFHPIPENDNWWGKGFTEWTNVRPAIPQFEGHYQPHVPDDFIGYYNLLDREVQAKQIELAKQYGIEGFCFYLYWFSGKRLLEQPLDNYLNDQSLDLPFCVCWANENWSRRWDGLESELLMVQNYSEQDDIDFIANIAKYLRDPRYIRIEGKPLLLIYRPNLFPDMNATIWRWRDWCHANGLGEIYLAYTQSFECVDPAIYGFDAAIEFPPNNSSPQNFTSLVEPAVDNFQSTVYDWRGFIERSENYQDPGYKLFRGVCPSWDNTARKKNKGTVFHNSCPKLFKQWLVNAFIDTRTRVDNADEQIVFINAWNEWAEGAHLEPDQRHGFAWLQAVRDAHQSALEKKTCIVIVSHDAHTHGAQTLCLNFARFFKEQFYFDVEMIVLGEGKLISKFAEYATVHRLDLSQANKSNSAIDQLLAKLRNKGAEMVIVNTTVSGKLVPHLKEHGFIVVSLVHEMPGILQSYRLQEHAERIAALSDKVVFPAQLVQDGFEAFIGRSLQQAVIRPQGLYLRGLLREGADKEAFRKSIREKLSLPPSAKIIMCAGYADHRKGFDLFVRANVIVMQRVPDTYALWVGHCDQRFVDESMGFATEEGFYDRFIFTGQVDNPQEYFVAADVYALTSREDPFPSVVMEALDAMTPVVAFTESGGFESLLKRDCGILVPADDHAAFAEALIELLQNPQRIIALAETGRNIVQSELSFRHYLFDLTALAGHPLYRVSVVVPNYNYEKYICQRLESVIMQSYPIFELIVLDDQSTDESVLLITEFLKSFDAPHRLLVNEQNSGSVFRQWQRGVEIARGDLVWIAEADDLADQKFLERLIPFFNDPQVVLAFSQSKQIDENDKILANDYLSYTNDIGDYWQEDYIIDGKEEIKRALCVKNTIPNVSGVLFRRNHLIQALNSAKEEMVKLKVAGDWALYLHLATLGRYAFKAESLNMHRRHVQSVTKITNHLDEVVEVQRLARKLVYIEPGQKNKQLIYVENLNEHFGRLARKFG